MTGLSLKMLRFWLWAALLAASGLLPGLALAQTAVDLELVIAVDVSLSMDLDEQRLQRDGYVAALRDLENQCWKDSWDSISYHDGSLPGYPRATCELQGYAYDAKVRGARLARSIWKDPAFADRLEATPITRARMTSISSALQYSGRLFESSGAKGIRRVIDVSGDGPNNAGVPVVPVRDELVAKGIVINGLPIMLKLAQGFFDLAELDLYYTDCVIGGTGSFMIPIKERSEFQTATRRKLLLEIAGYQPPARLIRVQASPPAERFDCLVGEKQWQRYMDGRFPN